MLNNRLFMIFLLMGLTGIMALTIFDSKQKKEPPESSEKHTPVMTNPETPTAGPNTEPKEPITANNDTEPEPYSSEQQDILNEIEQRIFSQDPYVELTSLMVQMSLCKKEYEQLEFLISSDAVFQQQIKLDQALKKDCENYRQQYPHVLAMSEKQIKNTFKPNSSFGRLIQAQQNRNLTQAERDENSQLTLLYALKEKNSSMIMLSALFLRYENNNKDLLQTILNSKDNNYIAQMNQMALTLLSCEHQNGQSCQSTSMLMVMSCAQNPDSCGLDFQTWVDKNTLSGMKRDVEKLMAYYQQLAN